MGHVRVATLDDAAEIAAIYAPYVLETAITFEDEPPSADEMANRIAATLPIHPYLVLEEQGAVVGYAYAGAHRARAAYRWSVDVTAYAHPSAHRRGVGRALYDELLRLLTQQGFHAAFAGIALPNEKSVGLHQAMGFQPLGVYAEVGFKLGRWHDVGWWRRPLAHGLPTSEPIPFAFLDDRTA
ncbi:arsinothricin resistance N-acetyltransferase ArsN1 family B [Phenylobacterium sp. 58.2.17]|uniref:arsinothricin resistance N-acetyltransferase ArsN1 family B n=1 Tax=Phenylobacterium sp. 58.2.17 TaxID=2969306 RepID=UPI002264D958|nr:arsinothricin resistance N-acetyltransferase ArsN1 family B [Phenylobacterium sp. 58.2.17]MCX7587809.1 GNAT family N-acetyltransferase [Phenylobacterium sp. 58.2.17]